MSREIKFRAWDREGKRWICFEDYFSPLVSECDDRMTLSDTVDWVQFTGLHDRNGKEIWEGDIIRKLESDWASKSENDKRTLEEYLISLTDIWEVIFHKLSASFVLRRQTGSYNPWSTDDEGFTYSDIHSGRHGWIEVIGNIYENPELLSGS